MTECTVDGDAWFERRFGLLSSVAVEAAVQTFSPLRKESPIMLTSDNVKEIDRIYMRNGSGKDVVANVAKQYGITEAFAGGIARALKEKRGPNLPDTVLESVTARSPSPPDRSLSGVSREVLESAKDAAVKANVAEAQIKAGNGASVSLDDLAALASFYA